MVDTSATPETSEIASTEIVNVNVGENVVATIETTTVELPTAEESAGLVVTQVPVVVAEEQVQEVSTSEPVIETIPEGAVAATEEPVVATEEPVE